MLIREGDERTLAIDVKLAALFAGIAGAVNTAGFQAVGYFSANMTGNVSALSDHIGLGQFAMGGLYAALIVIFIFGAFVSGLLIEAGRQRGIRGIYAYSMVLEGTLLLALSLADLWYASLDRSPLFVLGLSFVMGLQNAATTKISNARVRTTHVSGMATDIGLSLAGLFQAGDPRKRAIDRLRLQSSTIAAFLLGGIVSVPFYLAIGGWVFFAIALILFAIALPEVRRARVVLR